MDTREIDGLWCDDITFCLKQCGWKSCPRNKQNIRDRTIPHSFSIEIPHDCPKKQKESIEYTSENGCKGVLYNWHFNEFTGEWHYSMNIQDETGLEVLHSYNAKPKSKEELKSVVDGFRSLMSILEEGR